MLQKYLIILPLFLSSCIASGLITNFIFMTLNLLEKCNFTISSILYIVGYIISYLIIIRPIKNREHKIVLEYNINNKLLSTSASIVSSFYLSIINVFVVGYISVLPAKYIDDNLKYVYDHINMAYVGVFVTGIIHGAILLFYYSGKIIFIKKDNKFEQIILIIAALIFYYIGLQVP